MARDCSSTMVGTQILMYNDKSFTLRLVLGGDISATCAKARKPKAKKPPSPNRKVKTAKNLMMMMMTTANRLQALRRCE